MMKIAGYAHIHGTIPPLMGLGKHVIHMFKTIGATPGIDLLLLSPRDLLDRDGKIPANSELADFAVRSLPWKRKELEWCWNLTGRPKIDKYIDGAEWIYVPSEQFVPSKRAKLAVTCHHLEWFEKDIPWLKGMSAQVRRMRWRLALRPILEQSDVIFVISEFIKERMCDFFAVKPEKLVVLANGVERPFFEAAKKPRIPASPEYLLVIGGLTTRKGADYILNLGREIKHKKLDIEIYIAGNSEPKFLDSAKELSPAIKLLGYPSVPELANLAHHALAVLFPSRYEGFGIPVIEAMAAGTPAIISHWGPLKELARDAGIVVDPRDTQSMIKAVESLLESSSYRDRLVAAGRIRAADFTWEVIGAKALAAMGFSSQVNSNDGNISLKKQS
jgi:glycosyltransferase involved in cell wall biosynthesis